MTVNKLKSIGGERPRLVSIPPSDEQLLLKRFPEQGLAYDPEKIIESTKKASSQKRSNRWQIRYSASLKQAEALFSRNGQDADFRREGIIIRGGELSVYFRSGDNTTSSRAVFRDGIISREASSEVKVAALRALRTLRLAPQLPKAK